MPYITERDKDIFRYLSSGPATIAQIARYVNISLKKKYQKAEHENKAGKYIDGYQSTLQRLWILKKAGYLQSARYPNRSGKGAESLYALKERAIEVLVAQGYSSETIRAFLPSPYHVAHELEVTDIIRVIKKESYKSNYDVKIVDENNLKRMAIKEGVYKAYPDLAVALTLGGGKTVHIAVEIDNGSFLPRDMVEKLRYISMPFVDFKPKKGTPQDILDRMAKAVRPVFNICTQQKRIDELRMAFAKKYDPLNLAIQSKDAHEFETLKKHIFFGLLYDISSKGILGSRFISIGGTPAEITSNGIIAVR